MNTTLATDVFIIAKTKATKLKDIVKPPSKAGRPDFLIILMVFVFKMMDQLDLTKHDLHKMIDQANKTKGDDELEGFQGCGK